MSQSLVDVPSGYTLALSTQSRSGYKWIVYDATNRLRPWKINHPRYHSDGFADPRRAAIELARFMHGATSSAPPLPSKRTIKKTELFSHEPVHTRFRNQKTNTMTTGSFTDERRKLSAKTRAAKGAKTHMTKPKTGKPTGVKKATAKTGTAKPKTGKPTGGKKTTAKAKPKTGKPTGVKKTKTQQKRATKAH